MARARRRCSDCPATVPAGAQRCTACERIYEAARGTTTERGYGRAHQAMRARVALAVEAGRVRCWRCGEVIAPGAGWHLGHHDDGTVAGPEHDRSCNLRAAGLKAHQKMWSPTRGNAEENDTQ
jgi:hypothetical protein